MEERGADIYLCGHDHNMQHIQDDNVTSQSFDMFVNGGGGRGLYEYTPRSERLVPYSKQLVTLVTHWALTNKRRLI